MGMLDVVPAIDDHPAPRRSLGAAEDALRALVLDLKHRRPRGPVPHTLHCGQLAGPAVPTAAPPATSRDHALASDVIGALLERAVEASLSDADGTVWCWLERSGSIAPTAEDSWWESGVRQAAAERGLQARFAVVTRHGWRDCDSGTTRTWRRLRSRSALPGAA